MFVGYPGSGKSFLAKQIEKKSGYNYVTVCRDDLGTWQKCAAEAKKYLQVINRFFFNYCIIKMFPVFDTNLPINHTEILTL